MKLTNPTDEELNVAFAEKVAGWMQCERLGRMVWYDPEGGHEMHVPRFTEYADLVLPLLEKCRSWICEKTWDSPCYTIRVSDPKPITQRSDTFPRAAVIALLRAHGVEVEFK